MTDPDTKGERDRHMDALASKVAKVMHGENTLDVMFVTAYVAAHAIRATYDAYDDRKKALASMIEFVEKLIVEEPNSSTH